MKIKRNDIEIEYNEELLTKIREAYNKGPDEDVTDSEIVSFFRNSIENAISKGYGIVE
jgi:hypothetical protein